MRGSSAWDGMTKQGIGFFSVTICTGRLFRLNVFRTVSWGCSVEPLQRFYATPSCVVLFSPLLAPLPSPLSPLSSRSPFSRPLVHIPTHPPQDASAVAASPGPHVEDPLAHTPARPSPQPAPASGPRQQVYPRRVWPQPGVEPLAGEGLFGRRRQRQGGEGREQNPGAGEEGVGEGEEGRGHAKATTEQMGQDERG